MIFNKNWAGVDEVGRGCIAGPVTVCALILKSDILNNELTDSKKLSPKKREALFDKIIEISDYKIVSLNREVIDKVNILQATLLAMKKAIEGLCCKNAYIDGNKLPNIDNVNLEAVIKGDQLVPAISAASILAKVSRDRIMIELANKYPKYGFENHKGYGTKYHLEALEKYGTTLEHRTSFAPVKNYIRRYSS